MTMRVYASTDGSAPVLTGQAGSLVALLDAVLVNGYGAKTAAGWTKPYTATNQAAFRTGAGGQYYLDVTDTNAGSTGSSRVAGFATMSAVNTGTLRFPASGTNVSWVKSQTTDSTARAWYIFADNRRMWLFVKAGFTSFTTKWACYFFGEFFGTDTSWTGNVGLIVRASDWTGTLSSSGWSTIHHVFQEAAGEMYMAEKYSGGAVFLTRPVGMPMFSANTSSGNQTIGVHTTGLAYPHTPSGGIVVCPLFVGQGSPYLLNGRMPGVWSAPHNDAGADGDTFTGSGDLSGKSFQRFDLVTVGNVWVETSDTWA